MTLRPLLTLALSLACAVLPAAARADAAQDRARGKTPPPAMAELEGQAPASCNDAGTQAQLNACAADALAAADAQLNALWRELMAELDGQAVAIDAARAAQRQWIAFRDAEVRAWFPVAEGEDVRVAWGSMYPMSRDVLLADLTRARIDQLRARLAQVRGD